MSFVSTRCCVSYCLSRGPTSMSDRILCEQTYLTNIWTFRLFFFSFFFNKTHFHNCVFVSACSAALKWLGLTYKRTCHRLLCITLDWGKLESKSDSGHRITCLCCQDAVKLNLATKRLRDALCWEHSTREHAKNVSRVKVFGCFFFCMLEYCYESYHLSFPHLFLLLVEPCGKDWSQPQLTLGEGLLKSKPTIL